jgi:hypothetical protein
MGVAHGLRIHVSSGGIGARVCERLCGRDEREVRERLREVSHECAGADVTNQRVILDPHQLLLGWPALSRSVEGTASHGDATAEVT